MGTLKKTPRLHGRMPREARGMRAFPCELQRAGKVFEGGCAKGGKEQAALGFPEPCTLDKISMMSILAL